MKKLHVVLSCTNRKRRAAVPSLHLRAVPNGPHRLEAWIERVRAAPREVAVEDLYAGEFWSEGQKLRGKATARFEVDGWVISAGLGLVNVSDRACSYQATFSARHPDSVIEPSASLSATRQRGDWWSGLADDHGVGDTASRLADLATRDPGSQVIVCAGADYLTAVGDDLRDLQAALGADRVLIFASSNPGTRLEDSWVQVPGSVRTSLGGSMASTGVRACAAVLDDDALELEAARAVVARIVQSSDPLPHFDRKRLDDDEIRAWVVAFLATSPRGNKSVALREFRESGRACEQDRFGRLFEEASR